MSNIYCGIGELKGNQRLGTKEECIKKNQVRLYGLNKITKDDIENVKNVKNVKKKSSSKTSSTKTSSTKTSSIKTSSTKTSSTKSKIADSKKLLEINKENDKKFSINEIKKMKLGLEIHKNEIYMLNKKKNSNKNGQLSKADQKKYDEHMNFINKTEKFLNDALMYYKQKKALKK